MEESKKQSKIIFAVIGVAILLTLTVGLSFAIYSFDDVGGENTITTGTVSMSFTESTNVVDITNALPVQNLVNAQQGEYFEFTVKSTADGKMSIPYTLHATEVAVDTANGFSSLGKNQVHFYLTEVASGTETVVVDKLVSEILGSGSTAQLLTDTHAYEAAGSLSTTYRLRLWIPYDVDASSWTADTKLQYKLRIDVSATV